MTNIIFPPKVDLIDRMGLKVEFDKFLTKRFIEQIPPDRRSKLNVGEIVTVSIERLKIVKKPGKNVEEIEPSPSMEEEGDQNTVDNVEKLQPSGYREIEDSTTRSKNLT